MDNGFEFMVDPSYGSVSDAASCMCNRVGFPRGVMYLGHDVEVAEFVGNFQGAPEKGCVFFRKVVIVVAKESKDVCFE